MRITTLILSLLFALLNFHAHALVITCEDPIGNESAFILNGEVAIEKNTEASRIVYSIAANGKVTVLESSDGQAEEQRLIDSLEWSRLGKGYLGIGKISLDNVSGSGSLYIDPHIELTSVILNIDGEIVSGMSKFDCKETG